MYRLATMHIVTDGRTDGVTDGQTDDNIMPIVRAVRSAKT